MSVGQYRPYRWDAPWTSRPPLAERTASPLTGHVYPRRCRSTPRVIPDSIDKRQAKAIRRRHTAAERLQRDRHQAQQAAEALQQALEDLGLPKNLVAEIEGRLRSQQKLLSKIVGVMFPPSLAVVRTPNYAVYGAGIKTCLASARSAAQALLDQAAPTFRPGGVDTLWRHTVSASAATRSRWQWTWVGDDSVFARHGEQLGLVGTWWSGQEHRVLSGIDGVLLIVVIGDGKLVVPMDFAIRRLDPTGPGAPCRDNCTGSRSAG